MIRLLIVDDSKIIYQGLETMLAESEDLRIIGYAANGKEAIEQITQAETKPDVVLLDLLMPVMSGVEATKKITQLFPQIQVIILSSMENDPMIIEAIAAGAKGYLLKTTMAEDLTLAIHSVYRGASNFAPGVIDKLTKNLVLNSKPQAIPTPAKLPPRPLRRLEKPLFRHGDWLTIIISAIALCQIHGMGSYLAHGGLLLLTLTLLARPIKNWWSWPLEHRRAIGIVAFAAAVAHAFYATFKVLYFKWDLVFSLPTQYKLGIVIGVVSLLMLTPAAITSFQYFQRKLGKTWRKIHLLTLPALGLAILHTILAGSNYLGLSNIKAMDYVRTLTIIMIGISVLLIRHKSFWSSLTLNRTNSLASVGKK